jgi:hypothetical protein
MAIPPDAGNRSGPSGGQNSELIAAATVRAHGFTAFEAIMMALPTAAGLPSRGRGAPACSGLRTPEGAGGGALLRWRDPTHEQAALCASYASLTPSLGAPLRWRDAATVTPPSRASRPQSTMLVALRESRALLPWHVKDSRVMEAPRGRACDEPGARDRRGGWVAAGRRLGRGSCCRLAEGRTASDQTVLSSILTGIHSHGVPSFFRILIRN